MITPASGLARRAITRDTNLAMTRGTDHLKSSLAERWCDLELFGCNLTQTKSPTQNSPPPPTSIVPGSHPGASLFQIRQGHLPKFINILRIPLKLKLMYLNNSHLSSWGWFISLPRNREAGVPVDSCHAVLKAMTNEGRFSSQRVCWEL
jgi:hypothetical protein